MISFEPLWEYLEENNILKAHFVKNKILSSEIISRMSKDLYVNLSTIDRICQELKIPIERVVKITGDDGQEFK